MKKFKKIVLTLIQIALIAVIIYSLYNIGNYYYQNYKSTKKLRHIESIVEDLEKKNKVAEEDNDNEQSEQVDEPDDDFAISVVNRLKELNEDVIGYVKLDTASINYPVAYVKEDNDYYLYKDLDREYSLPGTIFMNGWNNPDFSDMNTTFFGHNLQVRSNTYEPMFKHLLKFENKEIVDSKKEHIVEVYTDKGYKKYIVFSAYYTNIYNNYIEPNRDRENWSKYLEKVKSDSINDFNIDYEFTKDSKILTLSTCENELYSVGRFVVHALEID